MGRRGGNTGVQGGNRSFGDDSDYDGGGSDG